MAEDDYLGNILVFRYLLEGLCFSADDFNKNISAEMLNDRMVFFVSKKYT